MFYLLQRLQDEANSQMSVISQASRALNLCRSTKEFYGSSEQVSDVIGYENRSVGSTRSTEQVSDVIGHEHRSVGSTEQVSDVIGHQRK